MDCRKIGDGLSVSPQIVPTDMAALKLAGFRAVICNRPDAEAADQPGHREMAKAAAGLEFRYLPVTPGIVTDETAVASGQALGELPGPVLAYCRTGTRSATLWSLSEAGRRPLPEILSAAKAAGYDMNGVARRIANGGKTPTDTADARFDVVIVGAGAGGISVAASLKARRPDLDIAVIDPAVAAFEPKDDAVILDGCRVVKYGWLVVTPGLKLDWSKIEGLQETLGRNGVTSNYRYDLAPYTWQLVQQMRSGVAIFTQPPMPIKCAGAPQKAMYLSGDNWSRRSVLKDIDIRFNNAGGVLFGVKEYVPALQKYVEKYSAALNFFHNLVAVDGPARTAVFEVKKPDAAPTTVEMAFEMMHVSPPQSAPDFIRVSPLADAADWVDVDQATLRHKSLDNIWLLRRVERAQCQDGGGGAQAGTGGGREHRRRYRRPRAGGALRRLRLRLLPADRRARQDRAGRVRLWRRAEAFLPVLADRRHQADPRRLAAEGVDAAADLLEGDAARQRMDGAAGKAQCRRRVGDPGRHPSLPVPTHLAGGALVLRPPFKDSRP
jgi:sulfide:quinone oxidoreductase